MECWKKDLPEYWTHEAPEGNLLSSFPDFRDFSFNSIPLLSPSRKVYEPEASTPILSPSRRIYEPEANTPGI